MPEINYIGKSWQCTSVVMQQLGFYMLGPWWELCLQHRKLFIFGNQDLNCPSAASCLCCINSNNLSPFFSNTN